MLIRLDKKEHKYSISSNPIMGLLSVSHLVSQYHDGFDADYHSQRLSRSDRGKYAGCSVDEILTMWEQKREYGSRLHEIFERQVHEFLRQGCISPKELLDEIVISSAVNRTMDNYWCSRMKVYTEQSVWIPVLGYTFKHIDELWPDHNVYWKSKAIGYAKREKENIEGLNAEAILSRITDVAVGGTMDLLLVDHQQRSFSILDLKTDDKIRTFSRNYFYQPISHLRDSTHNYYALKMSIYALMVQFWMPGYRVADLTLVHVPNGEGFRDFVELPYLKDEAHRLIRHYSIYE